MSEPREVCDVCGREKWAYSGLARTQQNCMRDFAWAPDDNLRDCWRLGYERLRAALARAHAEGLEAGLRQAARLASSATADPESRLIHPDIPFKDFSEPARGVAHATAQAIAAEILALIPAAPEVKDE